MTRNDITTIFGVAAATMAFSLVMFGPDRVGAVDEEADVTPLIVQPKMEFDGCEFTVTTESAQYGAGETPVLLVTAKNSTDQPVDARLWLFVQAQSPSSPMSRMPALPELLWSEECPIPLAAGETKTLRVETETALPAGKSISISMSNKAVTLRVATLSVPTLIANQVPNVSPDVAAFNTVNLNEGNALQAQELR